MRDISSPLDGIASPFGPQRTKTLAQLLFASSEPGFTFEPWDITTLFQDRAGTTPVTAAGQSVGLRLSKDQGLRQGPELVTNGDFSAGMTGWTTGSAITSSVVSGEAQITFGGSAALSPNNWFSQAGKLPSTTASYKVTFDATWVSGGVLQLASGYDVQATISANAGKTTYTALIKRGTSGTPTNQQALVFAGATAAVWKIDNISVRELAGNHQVAVSDAKRGLYGWMPKTGRRNLLTYTEQFDNAAWEKSVTGTGVAPVVTANAAVAPDGTTTADLVVLNRGAGNASTDISVIAQTVSPALPAGTYAGSFYVKGATGADVGKQIAFRHVGASAYQVITLTAAWQRIERVENYAVSAFEVVNRGSFTADNTVSIHLWGAQLEPGSTATAYQRVASQYDITEAGVPTCYYVQADGVDDAYVTPTITPNTDKVQVFAGVRKLSDAATGAIIEHSATLNSNNGSFFLLAPNANASTSSVFSSKGSLPAFGSGAVADLTAAPISKLVSGLGDISADTSTIRVNGTQVAQSTSDQGTGNYLAYPAYIYGREGTSLPFNGLDFGHAVRFGPNLDAATIARVEALIARNTPEVTL